MGDWLADAYFPLYGAGIWVTEHIFGMWAMDTKIINIMVLPAILCRKAGMAIWRRQHRP